MSFFNIQKKIKVLEKQKSLVISTFMLIMVNWYIDLESFFFFLQLHTHTHSYVSLHGGSDGKESACNARDPSSIPGLGRSPGKRNSNPLQYSCLGNPMDRGAWWATVYGDHKRVGHDLAAKWQQQHKKLFYKNEALRQGMCPVVGLLGHMVVYF